MTAVSRTAKIAVGGFVSAISIVLMMLTSVFTFLNYAITAFCGMILIVAAIEAGSRWAVAIYFIVSVFSILFVADKEAALLYIMFFGYYPIIKKYIDRLRAPVLEWLIKLALFNVSVVLAFTILSNLFGVYWDDMEELGKYSMYFMLGAGNVFFVLYDFAITRMITVYIRVWQKRFRKLFKVK